MDYTTLTVVYNTTIVAEGANGNASAVYDQWHKSSDRCCNPSDKGCIVLPSAIESVYLTIPPQLAFKLVEPWQSLLGQRLKASPLHEFIGCWSTPPFCSQGHDIRVILKDFTAILVGPSL